MKYPQLCTPYRFVFLVLLSVVIAGCSIAQASPEEIEEQWISSAHADATSAAFSNWNENDPAEIPASCAKCHSTTGYHDFLGLDGSAAGTVDAPAPAGTTVECEACHNDVSDQKQTALMPSGVELDNLGRNSDCMECHQGRASTVHVDEATAGMDPDSVNRDLSFVNVHNNAAGPILFGTSAMGGYEYEGLEYLSPYEHVPGFDDCASCHDPHTLKINTPKCRACHPGARSTAHLSTIRVRKTDYDGDGDTEEGIQGEIETIHERLLLAIRAYAALTKRLDNIVYDPATRPYFFDEDGEPYVTWTPRLLRAAYNYHFVTKSTGGYAHHPLYIIQLLYDSLTDLGARNVGMTRP